MMNVEETKTNEQNKVQGNFPSVTELVCPNCQKNDFKIIGTKGAKGKAIGMGMALGAIGNIVANSMSKDDYSLQPVQYKCNACKKKFESLPFTAKPEEVLEKPCMIHFTRLSCFAGMAVAQNVYLNGAKVGSVGNGKSIDFPTRVKNNTVFVTDQYGVAFKGCYKFVAQSGGTEEIKFKKKFK